MRSEDIHPGDVIAGKFRVRAILSRHPTLVVEAFHVEFDQRAVIKLLLPGTGDDKEIERFRREARVLSRLETEHAARIIDVGTQADGSFFLARHHVEGEDLAAYVKNYGPRPLPEAVLLVLQVAECVAETHSHGIILRELSPQNIAIARRAGGSPMAKITDFGTAKLMRDVAAPAGGSSLTATALFGLSPYSSPELVRKAKSVDHRTDVWSLGALLYFLVTGQPPFSGDVANLMLAITRQEPRAVSSFRGDLPPDFDNIIGWAMAKDLDRRFKNIHSFAHALSAHASSEGRVLVERIAQIAHQAKQRKGGAVPPPPVSFSPPPPTGPARPPGYTSVLPPPPSHPVDIGQVDFGEEMVGDDEATVVLGSSKLAGIAREVTEQMSGLGASAMRAGGMGSPHSGGVARSAAAGGLAIPPPPPSIPPSPFLPNSDRLPRLVPPAPTHGRRPPVPAAPDSGPGLAYARHDSLPPPALLTGGTTSARSTSKQGFDMRILWGALAASAVLAPVVLLLLLREPPRPVVATNDSPRPEAAAQNPAAAARPPSDVAVDPAAPAVVLEAAPPVPVATEVPVAANDNPPPANPGPAVKGPPPQPPTRTPPPPVRKEEPKPDPPKKETPAASGGTGRLLAIASGGSCSFSVNGSGKGTSSSLSLTLPAGNHTVVCKPTGGGGAKSRSVTVKPDQTAMLTFKL